MRLVRHAEQTLFVTKTWRQSSSLRMWADLRCQRRGLNLSKLSVWWLRLDIAIERIKPSHPRQQAKFDNFIAAFNIERPHQVTGMKSPAIFCTPAELCKRGCITESPYYASLRGSCFGILASQPILTEKIVDAHRRCQHVGPPCCQILEYDLADSDSQYPVQNL